MATLSNHYDDQLLITFFNLHDAHVIALHAECNTRIEQQKVIDSTQGYQIYVHCIYELQGFNQ